MMIDDAKIVSTKDQSKDFANRTKHKTYSCVGLCCVHHILPNDESECGRNLEMRKLIDARKNTQRLNAMQYNIIRTDIALASVAFGPESDQ